MSETLSGLARQMRDEDQWGGFLTEARYQEAMRLFQEAAAELRRAHPELRLEGGPIVVRDGAITGYVARPARGRVRAALRADGRIEAKVSGEICEKGENAASPRNGDR